MTSSATGVIIFLNNINVWVFLVEMQCDFCAVGTKFGKPFNNILIYIQQDATLYSSFYLETALHVSGGNSTHLQERKQRYLQQLVLVTP